MRGNANFKDSDLSELTVNPKSVKALTLDILIVIILH